ncbi:ankyrin repeat domain-containing protein 60 [Discoglossus pictus]
MASPGRPRAPRTGTPSTFSVRVRLRETGERFEVTDCSPSMKVGELRERLELQAGVPHHWARLSYIDEGEMKVRLSYIDEGDMPANSTFKFNGIIPGGTVLMRIWSQDGWSDLVKAAAEGNIAKLKSLGITADSTHSTPNSSLLNLAQRQKWVAARANVALYIAAHRGYLEMTRFLLKNGADVHYKSPLGNTPLHVAAAMGNCDCIDELLANGAQPLETNRNGYTPLDLARLWGQKSVERRLFLFQWRQRAATVSVRRHLDYSELFAHQKFDSKLRTWRCGPEAKQYMANLVLHNEFCGTGINAPRKKSCKKRFMEQGHTKTVGPLSMVAIKQ